MSERLVDGHGNFGSVDNDPAAAMRYTECRLAPLAEAMLLADLSQDTVEYGKTFDDRRARTQWEPLPLPRARGPGERRIGLGRAGGRWRERLQWCVCRRGRGDVGAGGRARAATWSRGCCRRGCRTC